MFVVAHANNDARYLVTLKTVCCCGEKAAAFILQPCGNNLKMQSTTSNNSVKKINYQIVHRPAHITKCDCASFGWHASRYLVGGKWKFPLRGCASFTHFVSGIEGMKKRDSILRWDRDGGKFSRKLNEFRIRNQIHFHTIIRSLFLSSQSDAAVFIIVFELHFSSTPNSIDEISMNASLFIYIALKQPNNLFVFRRNIDERRQSYIYIMLPSIDNWSKQNCSKTSVQ